MRKVKFKVGDKVYCPSASVKICTVKDYSCDDGILGLPFGNTHVPFDEHGVSTMTQIPTVFHATAENHALLEQLYGVKFEAPPKQKTPKEVIQIMLISGWDSVPCIDVRYSSHKFFANKLEIQRQSLDFLIPFDPKTGKTIIDYIDGEIVTE